MQGNECCRLVIKSPYLKSLLIQSFGKNKDYIDESIFNLDDKLIKELLHGFIDASCKYLTDIKPYRFKFEKIDTQGNRQNSIQNPRTD
jgi:hypothetical protein